jgi:hypothetical protein
MNKMNLRKFILFMKLGRCLFIEDETIKVVFRRQKIKNITIFCHFFKWGSRNLFIYLSFL